ncbi:AAA family ATPase [Faecalibacillus intestinalis]|uniref:AAA family ATPase n=1 Tax=Faecalibacillus intestinalis TaxID=1982626 RepID=UPI0039922924
MKLLPIGIENFKELIDKNYYYVDKTNLIANIINEKVVLYTRPRRFGKTLNMSMLYYFFSIKEKDNAYLFDYLNISKNKDALKHQNKYPTIFISLKEMKNSTFDAQVSSFGDIIKNVILQNKELLESVCVDESDRIILQDFRFLKGTLNQLKYSLKTISRCLYNHYHQKVIILIDEYDVPLQSAYQNNYYDEMVEFLRNVFSSALKTNDALEKSILTGCLRISKESIFTGLNNFKAYSILYKSKNEFFGFNENEVKQLLEDYQLSSYMDEVKEWYDGYLFGNIEIYNPWSTLMYVDSKLDNVTNQPVSFWANTSGNDLVVNYIQNGSDELHEEFEQLIQGKSLEKYIKPELTYREMDNINNIYSFLLLTGYLRVAEDLGENKYKLIIPNKEVYEIYKQSFMSYFEDYTFVRKEDLYQCLVREDVDQANEILGDILSRSISYFDNQESFYHGFLVGLFSGKKIKSNREAMHGRFDLCILPKQIFQTALILECKHSKSVKELVSDAKEGAKQIIDNKYEDEIINDGYLHVKGYGISFYKKYCYIEKAQDE